MLAKAREQQSSFLRSVPFVLVEDGNWPNSGFVQVSLDELTHPLPLTTVYQRIHLYQATTYTYFQLIFGNRYPVALLDEEKILSVGKEITAVGICRTNKGALEIRSCPELPCYLSDKTKDGIEEDLAIDTRILFWSGIVLGTLSIGILSYALARNWWRWKDWRQRRRQTQELRNEIHIQSSGDEEGDIPDGQLCVICLMRQRRSAFFPCGHLVCCPQCALSVELESSPKCPVCRQSVCSSSRIYFY